MEEEYAVYVDGTEISDWYINKDHAIDLVKYYKDLGYDDVVAENVYTCEILEV